MHSLGSTLARRGFISLTWFKSWKVLLVRTIGGLIPVREDLQVPEYDAQPINGHPGSPASTGAAVARMGGMSGTPENLGAAVLCPCEALVTETSQAIEASAWAIVLFIFVYEAIPSSFRRRNRLGEEKITKKQKEIELVIEVDNHDFIYISERENTQPFPSLLAPLRPSLSLFSLQTDSAGHSHRSRKKIK